jgi:hypothetical protein
VSAYTPTVVVEFAFGSAPFATPSWTTADDDGLTVESIEIERGRSSEFDDFPAGKCSVVFKDSNRILDPSNAAGPYYGDLLPRVPMRVVATVGVTDYVRFYGFVDGWPLQNARGMATVRITATDASKILTATPIPTSEYATTIIADGPVGYWRLGATTGEVVADSSGNAYDGTYSGVVKRGAPSVLPFSADGSMGFVANNRAYAVLPVEARVDFPMSLEMWVQSDVKKPLEPYASRKYLYVQYANGGATEQFFLALAGDSATDQFVILDTVGSGNSSTSWSVDLNDGAPHHVVLTIDAGVNPSLIVDGAYAPVRASAFGGVTAFTEANPYIGGSSSDPEWVGRIDEVSVWDVVLTDAQISEHYIAGTAPWDGDSTGDRITRVLDLVGWPAGLRAIDNGEFSVGPAQIEGRNAWDYMRSVAESEQGRLFIAADGTLTFHERGRYFIEATETTSQFTFSDDGAGDGLHAGLNFVLDDRWIINTATATRDGGEPQTAVATASRTTYGPSEKSLSGLVLQHDRNARQLAEYLVFRYKDPLVRAEGWSLQPELDGADWADIFGLEIGHRVTLECTPINVGSQIVMDQHLERIHDTITPSTWTVEFNGSPPDPYMDSYFTWGGDGATQGWDAGYWR